MREDRTVESGRDRNPAAGFTLIELLVVVAIIGIITAIAVPGMISAVNRGKQKRTMADVRALALSLEAYAVDVGIYPTPNAGSADAYVDMQIATNVSAISLPYIVPTYIKTWLTSDGWGNPIHVGFDTTHQEIGVGSWGKDGINDGVLIQGPTHNFTDDIVFLDGQFVKYPEGVQY